MILCVGEILADMIGTKKDGVVFYEQKAGGAPFNVACAAKRFGASVSFVGCVGNDLVGRFLTAFSAERQLDKTVITVDPERNTTLAFVQLDEEGERSFCFYRHGTADYHLPPVEDALLEQATTVHIGSLMLSEKEGLEYAKKLAHAAKERGIPVSFDVNFRTDIFPNREEAVCTYRQILECADIVKFSEDEVEIFTESYIKNMLADKLVFITLGERGAEWRYGGKTHRIPAIHVTPVDTTGAGDAFYAGVLSRLDHVSPADYTDEILDQAVRFGNITGALNTLGRGAIDCLPSMEQIEIYLK